VILFVLTQKDLLRLAIAISPSISVHSRSAVMRFFKRTSAPYLEILSHSLCSNKKAADASVSRSSGTNGASRPFSLLPAHAATLLFCRDLAKAICLLLTHDRTSGVGARGVIRAAGHRPNFSLNLWPIQPGA
jgi:hypothetical protein